MKVLQTVKYYKPSKGGMESVVGNIVDGIIECSTEFLFTVYANNYKRAFKKEVINSFQLDYIKEATPFILKSQPLNVRYSSLGDLINDTDIVHHHYPFPNMEVALLRNIELLKNKRLIITWHANIKNSRWSWISKYYDPLIIKLLDVAEYIVVTSPQLVECSNLLALYRDKIRIIPLSFDPKIVMQDMKVKQFPEQRNFKLLFVGKLRAYKGVEYLINAIKELDVELTIVGDGENEDNLKNQVANMSIGHKVRFLKKITDDQLAVIYQESDLFILPSINEAEAFGVVQLEAMCNGLPVINTRLESGVPFVSIDGFSGLTVEPKSSDELKGAILRIISDKLLYEEFSRNAISRSKEFSRNKLVESYLNLYKS